MRICQLTLVAQHTQEVNAQQKVPVLAQDSAATMYG